MFIGWWTGQKVETETERMCNLFLFRSNIPNRHWKQEYNHMQKLLLLSLYSTWCLSWSSRAFGLALLVELVPVARTLVLVPIGPRRNTFALSTAYSTVPQTPILNPCRWASVRTLVAAISCHKHTKIFTDFIYILLYSSKRKSYTSLHRRWLAPRKRSLEEENITVGWQRQASFLLWQERTLAIVVGVFQLSTRGFCFGISKSIYL